MGDSKAGVLCVAQVLTAEGENFLLTQQTGRYLLKAYEKLRRGSAKSDEPKIKYLENVDDLLQGNSPFNL